MFVPGFGNDVARRPWKTRRRSALGSPAATGTRPPRIAFTTDSFVVRPLFFPGGDIGRLAVHGTVNDLAVGGATPLFLSAAFILEEGLPHGRSAADRRLDARGLRRSRRVARHRRHQGRRPRQGRPDLHHHLGHRPRPGGTLRSRVRNARPGDRVLVSGTIGDHGIAIMSVREGIEFETVLESDSAPLNDLTRVMLDACPAIRCMRDPTRGGLSSALNELADASRRRREARRGGDPGAAGGAGGLRDAGARPALRRQRRETGRRRSAAATPTGCWTSMRGHPLGRDAAVIGEIVDDHPGMVVMRSLIGGERVVTMLAGEQLPRIC